MPKVIGVKFRTSPRVYFFAPTEGEEYVKGTAVVVETQRGVELATVVQPPHDVDDGKVVAPLKPIMRIATQSDLDAAAADADKKREILATAKEKVAARGLDMKIVDCEFTVDHGKLVLYFTAEQRVDFRDLVRDLASAFKMRIDLRQIGSRDECKLIGTLSPCGMPCCCGRFECDEAHISIKMAKTQNLALNPTKINGMCGRLLCCLAYENKTYEDIMKRMPKHGAWVTAPDGRRGTVVSVTPLSEKVRVRFGNDENFEFAEFPLEELKTEGAPQNNGGGQGDRQNRNGDAKPKRDDNRNAQGGDNRNGGKNRRGDNRNNNNNSGNNDRNDNDRNKNGGGNNGNGNGEKRNKKKNKKDFRKNRDDRPKGENGGNGGNVDGAQTSGQSGEA